MRRITDRDNLDYDHKRTEYLNNLGFKVLRIWNNDIRDNLTGVVEEIKHCLE
jgi:very-short-patch-repair endonuclease